MPSNTTYTYRHIESNETKPKRNETMKKLLFQWHRKNEKKTIDEYTCHAPHIFQCKRRNPKIESNSSKKTMLPDMVLCKLTDRMSQNQTREAKTIKKKNTEIEGDEMVRE